VWRAGLCFIGSFGKLNPSWSITLREDAIRIVRDNIKWTVSSLNNAKEEKSMREAVQRLEESVQMLKELLSFPMRTRDEAKKPAEPC
jgi:hypothetical protein